MSNQNQPTLNDIHYQVMWNRLIAVVEEQALVLIRTAFSASVREAGDLSAGIFDCKGRMLAQAVTGTPGHVNTMAEAVPYFIEGMKTEGIFPGDCYLTNDPWQGTGHLHDITMVSPIFHRQNLIGYIACTGHVLDIGGRGFGADGKSVYEEGLQIPIMKFLDRGEVNRNLVKLIRANVRTPDEVVGDCHSFAACNEVGATRLIEMLNELTMDGIDALAEFIFSRSAAATRSRIAEISNGEFHNTLTVDGYDESIHLAAVLIIEDEKVCVNFDGSDPQSSWGINVPIGYTRAYACYGLKCAIAPDVPNNTASLEPFEVTAPAGTILNARRPAPVALRHIIGHMLPDLVLGALAQAMPEHVPAEGASSLWNIHISTRSVGRGREQPKKAEILMFNSGGTGARPTLDGLSATAFPSGVHTMPVEATEHTGPIVVWRKELRPDSGGAGVHRGGLGQVIEIAPARGYEFDFSAMFDRIENAPRGRNGGADGDPGAVALRDGAPLRSKGWQHVNEDQCLQLSLPGGGGHGEPAKRELSALCHDVEAGFVSMDNVRAEYGVEPDALRKSPTAK